MAKKADKRVFRCRMVLKGKRLPVTSLGRGVIGEIEIEIEAGKDRQPWLAVNMLEAEKRLAEELLRFEWKEIKSDE